MESTQSISSSESTFNLDKYDTNTSTDNMISNLPLLFAGGYPTSMEKINESQLERFIPFMVECSLGNVSLPLAENCNEPEWWPEDVPFTVPLQKPANFTGNWLTKLKKIVAICYQFHRSIFLLRFCENLATYQPETLRFINNYNQTTSLFYRNNKKLLVTFRNENMLYDQHQMSSKKTLLRRVPNASLESNRMVEQSLFDIYLCDYCEAELYSMDAYNEHEKTCHQSESESDSGDVINRDDEEPDPETITQQQANFLQHFHLASNTEPLDQNKNSRTPKAQKRAFATGSASKKCGRELDIPLKPDKIRRLPRRAHASVMLTKCQIIPVSSPAGQRIISITKVQLAENYQRERIERYERFCNATPLAADHTNRPKFMDQKPTIFSTTTLRSRPSHYRTFKFPRRQFSKHRRDEAVCKFQQILLHQMKCKPLTVLAKQLSQEEIESIQLDVKKKKFADPLHIVDTIDLCSDDSDVSDDDEVSSRNALQMKSSNRSPRMVPIFVDCSIINDQKVPDTAPTDSIFQSLITNSESIGYGSNELQQNKENHLMQFINDQTNVQAAKLSADDKSNIKRKFACS